MNLIKPLPRLLFLGLILFSLAGCTLRRPAGSAGDIAPLAPPISAQAMATVSIRPQTQQIDPGGTTTAEIWIENVTNLAAADIEVRFDPAILQVVDADPGSDGIQIQPGDFLAANFIVQNSADNNSGIIRFVLTQVAPTPPVSGTGLLALMTFTGANAGNSNLSITTAQLASGDAQALPVQTQDGEIGVGQGQQPTATTPVDATATLLPGETATIAPTAPTTATVMPTTTAVPLTVTPSPTDGVPATPTPTPTLMPPTVTPPPVVTVTPLPTLPPPPTATPGPPVKPTPLPIAQPVYVPPSASFGFCYRTQPGENLHSLAEKFHTSPNAIRIANDLYPVHIKAQQTLFIPTFFGNGPNAYRVQPGDTLAIIAERCKLPVTMLAKYNNLLPDAPLFRPAGAQVTLLDGQTITLAQDTVVVHSLLLPIPPYPPPTRYQYPSGPIPIVPYSEPYPKARPFDYYHNN